MDMVTANLRVALYRYLAAAYLAPPNEELLNSARDPHLWDGVAEVIGQESVTGLRAFAAGDKLASDEALEMAYTALFRIPQGSYVTPFESVYRDAYNRADGKVRRRLMGPSAQRVSAFYDAAGCKMNNTESCGNMPDYIGAELDFMRFLSEQELEAEGRGEEEQVETLRLLQRRFLQEHLGQWVDEVTGAIEQGDDTGFYAGIAELTRSMVSWDISSLEAVAA